MRIRSKKWASNYIKEHDNYFINDLTDNNFYSDKNINSDKQKEEIIKLITKKEAIEMEVGCGKGQFILEKARQNPEILYIAVEKFMSVIVIALRKIIENKVDNVLFYCGDIKDFVSTTALDSKINKIYLNFSDPWPKKRHAKRRLTSSEHLKIFKKLLKAEGEIEQKTDNDILFDYSIVNIANDNDLKINEVFVNLHNTSKENIVTEYERKFSEKGFTIKYLNAQKKEK